MDQMDRLERLFEPYGSVPWDELITSLWKELLSYVDEVWLALYSRFILPNEEHLPLPYELVDRAESPSGGYSDAPPCATAPPIPTLPIRTPVLVLRACASTEVQVFPRRTSPAYSALLVIPAFSRTSRILRGTKAHQPGSPPLASPSSCGDQCFTQLLLL